MINRVVLVGRLTKDPELRYTPSGLAVVRFTVAVNRQFQGQNGEKEADFINCVAWRKQAENLANYQRKGNLVGVEGRIQTGSYEKDGQRVYTTEVVADTIQFLEPRSTGAGAGAGAPMQPQYGGGGYGGGQQGFNNNPPQQNVGGNQGNPNQDPFGGYSSNQPPQNQQNYTRMDEDPFASNKGPIEVTEDDLPF